MLVLPYLVDQELSGFVPNRCSSLSIQQVFHVIEKMDVHFLLSVVATIVMKKAFNILD